MYDNRYQQHLKYLKQQMEKNFPLYEIKKRIFISVETPLESWETNEDNDTSSNNLEFSI